MATYNARAKTIIEALFDKTLTAPRIALLVDVLAQDIPENELEGKTPAEKRAIVAENYVETLRQDIRQKFRQDRTSTAVRAAASQARQDAETELGEIDDA